MEIFLLCTLGFLSDCKSHSKFEPLPKLTDREALTQAWEGRRPFELLCSLLENNQTPQEIDGHWRSLPLELGLRREAFLGSYQSAPSSADAYHLAGLWRLVQPLDEADVSQAIKDLETARSLDAENLAIALDLCAAYFYLAKKTNHLDWISQAYRLAKQCVDQAPAWFQAQFNWACILEDLGLHRQALLAWQDCLQVAPNQAWSAKVTSRIAFLTQPGQSDQWEAFLMDSEKPGVQPVLRKEHWENAQSYIETMLLEKGGLLPGSENLALRIAGEMAATDPYWLSVIEALPQPGSEENQKMRNAFQLCKVGLEKKKDHDEEGARHAYAEAEKNAQNHPFVWRIRYYQAELEWENKDKSLCFQIVEKIVREASNKGYFNLGGEARWLSYIANQQQRQQDQAMVELSELKELFQKANRLDNLAGVWNMEAEYYFLLGEFNQSWKSLQNARDLLPRVSKAKRHAQVYLNGTSLLWAAGVKDLAFAFGEESVSWAKRYGEARTLAAAHIWMARLNLENGNPQPAELQLNSAEELLSHIKQKAVAAQLTSDVMVSKAMAMPASDSKIVQLEKAYSLRISMNYRVWEPEILMEIARTYDELGYLEKAKEWYGRTLEIIESDLLQAKKSEKRSLLRHRSHVYQLTSELMVKLGLNGEAFEVFEHKRARHILGAFSKDSPQQKPNSIWQPLSLVQVQSLLPEETSILIFYRDSEGIGGWLIQNRREIRVHLTDEHVLLEKQIQRLAAGVESGIQKELLIQDARELYDLLIGPFEDYLQGERVGLVLESPLHRLPFAALMNAREQFWVETHILTLSPSASVFVLASKHASQIQVWPSNQVSLLGVTHLSASLGMSLSNLEGVRQEMKSLQILWGVQAKTGSEATKAKAFEMFHSGGIIHLAGHTVESFSGRETSNFLFAPQAGDLQSGVLHSDDLEDFDLQKVDLLVLSGCKTGVGPWGASEGVKSLAQMFLARGVPAVVASNWEIADRETANFMVAFHKFIKAGATPAEALAWTQREQIQQNCTTDSWAGFLALGHAN